MDLKEQILVALGLNKAEEEIKLEWQSKGVDGTIYVSTAEELESGVDVSVLTEDGTTIPLPVGTYKTEDGVSFRVEEEGVVGEVIESETEEEVEAEEEKEEMAKEDEDNYEEESPAEKADWAKSYEEMKDRVDNLEDAIADIKARMGDADTEDVEMTEEVVEPSDKPRTVTTKTTEVKEFSAEEEIKKLKAENEKLKTELAASPADKPINTNKFSSESKNSLTKKEISKLTSREKYLHNLYNN
jgi:hypothetical protein|tara:strand:- start:89 stop:817 length:729 start_codon:yes stop_codon:yes gene_type:complete